MAEEITNPAETGMEQDYLAQIQELKRNSVSRESYDKMRDENKKLLEAIVNGNQLDISAEPEQKKSIDELRQSLFNTTSTSNLEFISNALELREALIEAGEEDPFVPQGHKISATREDYEMAEKVAEGFKHCIEYAQGDSEVFTNELQRITKDVIVPGRKYR